jgi:hypothetical protein
MKLCHLTFTLLQHRNTTVPKPRRAFCNLSVLQITPILKGRMMTAGTLMVGYQPDDVRPNFFRNIISSAAVVEADVDFLLAELDRLGHDL